MKRKHVLVLCLIMVFGLLACTQKIIKPAYDSAVISKTAYTASLTAMGDLYKRGLISEATKAKAIEYGNIYMRAHNGMVEALAVYREAENPTSLQAYLAASSQAATTFLDLLNYCTPYIVKGGN